MMYSILAFYYLFQFSLMFFFVKYVPITYGRDYKYPVWAEVMGWMISLSSMVSIKSCSRNYNSKWYLLLYLPGLVAICCFLDSDFCIDIKKSSGKLSHWLNVKSLQIWVPGYAVYFLMTSEGTLAQRIQKGVTPTIKPRADALDVQSRKLSR